nr:methyl-accepting chemotaxis protein [Desulfovibrio inopinatus]
MSIRRKIFLPMFVATVLLGVAGYLVVGSQLSAISEDFINQIVENKVHEIESGIATSSRLALEQAALFSQTPAVIKAYMIAEQGNINDENDAEAQKARELLRTELAPYLKGFSEALGGSKFQLHFHLKNGRSLVRLWREKQVKRNGKWVDVSDDISSFRKTVLDVNRTGQPVMGIELGRGGFVFRGLAPVKAPDGRQLGSVEVLFAFAPLLENATSSNQFMTLYMDAQYLDITRTLKNNPDYPVLDGKYARVASVGNQDEDAAITSDFLDKAEDSYIVKQEDNMAVAAFPVKDYKGKRIGALIYMFSTQSQAASILTAKLTLAGALAAILVFLALIVQSVFVKYVAKPIDKVITKIKDITEDRADLGDRLFEGSGDEMAELAIWFNRLMTKLGDILCLNDAVLNAVPDPLFVSDENQHIILANKATAALVGKTPDEVKGEFCGNIFKTSHCGKPTCPVRQIMDKGTVDDMRIECDFGKGRMVVKPVVDAMHDCNGNLVGYLELAQDITSMVVNEERIQESFQQLKSVNGDINAVSIQIADSLTAISGQVEEVANGAGIQRQRMAETVTAMTEMNSAVLDVARNAGEAAEQATLARSKAEEGASVVKEAVQAIAAVQKQANALKDNMAGLGQKAQDIGQIMTVISDIADQTNLLALNAAIEAARAGEAGRGFAVVADEVRKLAEKTMNATGEVGKAIAAIQSETQKSVDITDAAAKAVERATDLSSQSGDTLSEIVDLISRTTDQVQAIAAAAEQQSASSEEISRAIEDVDRISSETAEGMNSSANAISDVADLTGQLKMIASSE